MTNQLITLQASTLTRPEGDRYEVTMLVGDGTYRGEFVPRDEIARAAPTMAGRPVNVNHSQAIEDIVGVVVQAFAEAGTLKGVIQLNPNAPKYAAAKAFLDDTMAAGAVPNVSVEFYREPTREGERVVARKMRFVALGLVWQGECNDSLGCGVHRRFDSSKEGVSVLTEATTTPATPASAPIAALSADCGCNKTKNETTALSAQLAAALAEVQRLSAERDSLKAEKELAPLRQELSALAPGFPVDGKSKVELSAAIEAAKLVASAKPATAERKTQLAADAGAGAPSAADVQRAELRKMMGLP